MQHVLDGIHFFHHYLKCNILFAGTLGLYYSCFQDAVRLNEVIQGQPPTKT